MIQTVVYAAERTNSDIRGRLIVKSLDLVFDISSYCFSVARSFLFSYGIHIPNEYRKKLELKPPNYVFEVINSEICDSKAHFEEFHALFLRNLPAIKPHVHSLDLISYLKQYNYQLLFYSYMGEEIDEKIRQYNASWFAEEISSKSIGELMTTHSDSTKFVISSSMQDIETARNCNVLSKLIYIKNCDFKNKVLESVPSVACFSSFEDLDISLFSDNYEEKQLPKLFSTLLPRAEYSLRLREQPLGNTYQGFVSYAVLPQSIEVKSVVVYGKNRAGKELGIPTANFDVTEAVNAKIKYLLNGVYVGKILRAGTTYPALIFLGYSEYFGDLKKYLEAYIFEDFEYDFYGEYLELNIHYFTRPEADFRNFDHLIKSIHCDVYQGALLAKKLLGLENRVTSLHQA